MPPHMHKAAQEGRPPLNPSASTIQATKPGVLQGLCAAAQGQAGPLQGQPERQEGRLQRPHRHLPRPQPAGMLFFFRFVSYPRCGVRASEPTKAACRLSCRAVRVGGWLEAGRPAWRPAGQVPAAWQARCCFVWRCGTQHGCMLCASLRCTCIRFLGAPAEQHAPACHRPCPEAKLPTCGGLARRCATGRRTCAAPTCCQQLCV